VDPAGSCSGGSAVPAAKSEGGWKYPRVHSCWSYEPILSTPNFGWTQNRYLWLCMVTANGCLTGLNLNGSGSSITAKAPRWAQTQSGAQNRPSSGPSALGDWRLSLQSLCSTHNPDWRQPNTHVSKGALQHETQVHLRATSQTGHGRCNTHNDEEVLNGKKC
jgi:hypothetical protein